MKVWITKYALTSGIEELHGGQHWSSATRFVTKRHGWDWVFKRPDWHTTKEEAIARAEEMRTKKIANLKEQISKLEKLKF